jgi:acetyltransferase-like isoleucine patch superfamily enzyme
MPVLEFGEKDLWPFSVSELESFLGEILPLFGSAGNCPQAVLSNADTPEDVMLFAPSIALTTQIDFRAQATHQLAEEWVAIGSLPSGRREIAFIVNPAGKAYKKFTEEIVNRVGATPISDQWPALRVLPIRYPWDLFATMRYVLEHAWAPLCDYLVQAWSLKETGKGVFVAHDAHIDSSVVFRGNAIVKAGAVVRTGAIIGENAVIADGAIAEEYCRIAKYCIVGPGSQVGHCAEVSGCLLGNCRVRHFAYFRGVLGAGANLGAGTACGTDRLDGTYAKHMRAGQEIAVTVGANEIYLGSGARTGVGTLIMAGSMLGKRAVIGPGVAFSGYLLDGESASQKGLIREHRSI